MEPLREYQLALNQLHQTIQYANFYAQTNNLIELEKTQNTIDQQVKLLRNTLDSTKLPRKNKLDKEVSRWNYVQNILTESLKGLNSGQAYEMKKILERWLLTLANDKRYQEQDEIFSKEKLNPQYPANIKMLSEMQEKRIPNMKPKYNSIIREANNYLTLTVYPKSNLPIVIDENTIQINDYTRILPPGKLSILLQMNNDPDVIGSMIMRYACLIPGGQQWAIPLEMYQLMVTRYGVTVEGFASPINSQILYLGKNLNYCSLFPDTDQPYGSSGDFFSIDFLGRSVYANPPYVPSVMDRMAQKIIQTCNNAGTSSVRFFITVPEWTDAQYYMDLMSSPYLVFNLGFLYGQHYYVDTNKGFEKVSAKFGTRLFVLAVNIIDDYNDIITFTDKLFHS